MKRDFRHAFSFLIPVSCVLVFVVLYQFLSVQMVLGYYDYPVQQTSDHVIPGALENKTLGEVQDTVGLPVEIQIPRIGVSAPIGSVGLTKDGSMAAPSIPRDTAWYMLGPKPGEAGSAVIAGHVNWWYGATGVFSRLTTLKPGDVITVTDDLGATISFVVRKSRTYGQKEDATSVFHSSDGKAHLNLVTCAGVWNKLTGQYSKRYVVFADKVVE